MADVTVPPVNEPKFVEGDTVESFSVKISDFLKRDIFLINCPMRDSQYGKLIKEIPKKKYHDALVILLTNGGDPNAAYRMARLFTSLYYNIEIFVPSYCKSAGTLLAICATKIYMSIFGELGPLDVQLLKEDELWERRSGLIGRNALKSLREEAKEVFSDFMFSVKDMTDGLVRLKMATDIAASITNGLLGHVYGKLDPLSIGTDYMELHVALEYGLRLAEVSKNIDEESIHKLVHDYPAHNFIIDYEEAKSLFNNVERPPGFMYKLITLLGENALTPIRNASSGIVRLLSERPSEDGDHGGTDHDEDGKGETGAQSAG
jgi:hypothetical protein